MPQLERIATPGLIASAQRALRVLEVVAEAGDGVTAKAIARRAELQLSTAYQLINTLVHDGYLVRLANARGFGLGYKLFELQSRGQAGLCALPSVAAVLHEVELELQAPLYFAVFRDESVVVAEVADCDSHPRAAAVDVGSGERADRTVWGRVMLAALPLEERHRYLRGVPRQGPRRAQLDEQLRAIAAAGVALDADETGSACLAVCVRDGAGHVCGAVATSAPTDSLLSRRHLVEPLVRIAAARIARVLSATTTPPATGAVTSAGR